MQGGNVALFQKMPAYTQRMGRVPRALEEADLDPQLCRFLQQVPDDHAAQVLGYPALWDPEGDKISMSYVVIHRLATDRDSDLDSTPFAQNIVKHFVMHLWAFLSPMIRIFLFI